MGRKGIGNLMVDWNSVTIKNNRGHVEVFTLSGQFLFSEDTEKDAIVEINKYCIENSMNY